MSTSLTREILIAAAIATAFVVIFAAGESWRRSRQAAPEWTRKLVHVAGGLLSLGLPWLLRSHWTVLALGGLLGALLLLTRRLGLLSSVHAVERRSQGVLYFPLAVYLVYLLAADRPIFYLISVLTLVVPDALAALVGTSYGRVTYRVEAGRRSLEGSAVFFLATFLAVHLPLLLLTEIDRTVSVLVGVQVALLVTILEAISLDGADNLIVPLGTYLLLLRLTPQPAPVLGLQVAAQLAILGVLFLLVWRLRLLTASGTLAASLFFYGVWSLGGATWVIPPVVALLLFAVILRLAAGIDHGPSARYQVLAVFYTTLVPAAVLLLNDVMRTALRHPAWEQDDPLFPLFVAAIAAQLALLALVFWEGTPWIGRPAPWRLLGSLAVGVGGMAPVLLITRAVSTPELITLVTVPVMGTVLYVLANAAAAAPRERPWDGRLRAACVGVGTLLLLPLLLPTGG